MKVQNIKFLRKRQKIKTSRLAYLGDRKKYKDVQKQAYLFHSNSGTMKRSIRFSSSLNNNSINRWEKPLSLQLNTERKDRVGIKLTTIYDNFLF